MAIKYALYENQLTSDPDDCMAVIQPDRTYTVEEVIDFMRSRGSTVTKAEALAVLEEYALAIEQILLLGGNITTELFNLSVSIKGVFTNKNDTFDPKRHFVKVNISPGIRLKKVPAQLQVERVAADKPMPNPLDFKDIASNTLNEALTSGGVGQLTGSRLKIDESDANQGIYIIANSTGTETKVSQIIRNKPAELLFMLPAGLAAGEYTIEVRVIIKGTKEIRTGTLPYDLTVA